MDLSKFDKDLDKIIQELINDLSKLAKDHMERGKISKNTAIAHFRYMLLKGTMILSQALEKKVLDIIDNADNERLKDLFEDIEKP